VTLAVISATAAAGLKVRGDQPPPQLRGELGGRLREGIRKKGKRREGAPQLSQTTLSTGLQQPFQLQSITAL